MKHFTCALAVLCLSPLAFAQDKNPTQVKIEGHVVKPAKLEPTDDMIRKHIKLPPGFRISVFATDMQNARMLAVDPETGNVYLTRRTEGDVVLLQDADNDGKADRKQTVAARPQMHGIAIHKKRMYLATVNDVYVADINADGTLGNLQRIIDDLPDGGQHPNRTIAVGPDEHLYISVGSTCNACNETNPESATILRATLDGKSRTIFASGLRNTIGFGWQPRTGAMYGADHGIDWLGDDEQKEEFNLIEQGKQYGWPYIYADGKKNPQDEPPGGVTLDEWKKLSKEPLLLYNAHAAPMQMVFYTGKQFPIETHGNAFIAMRGSWNRETPSGYEIARIRTDDTGKPVAWEPFITGWRVDQGDGKWGQLGRLAGIAMAKDGSLLVSDDANGVIYRISYDKNAEAK